MHPQPWWLLDVLLHVCGSDTAAVMADSPVCLACGVHYREYGRMTASGASGGDKFVHHAVPIGLALGSPNNFLAAPDWFGLVLLECSPAHYYLLHV